MTDFQWKVFCNFRDAFKKKCKAWEKETEWLIPLQMEAAKKDGVPFYEVENPLVYNTALDEITKSDEIKLIVISDNPGKNEQLNKNRRYLVGQAGKLGERFFRINPELNVDFRKNVIILNKTPIHTAKTKQIKFLLKEGGENFEKLFVETQNWMARETIKLYVGLNRSVANSDCEKLPAKLASEQLNTNCESVANSNCEGLPAKSACGLWMVGYSELKPRGLFAEYAKVFSKTYKEYLYREKEKAEKKSECLTPREIQSEPLLFQHFSMNRFSIDLKKNYDEALSLASNLQKLGLRHRKEILGW